MARTGGGGERPLWLHPPAGRFHGLSDRFRYASTVRDARLRAVRVVPRDPYPPGLGHVRPECLPSLSYRVLGAVSAAETSLAGESFG